MINIISLTHLGTRFPKGSLPRVLPTSYLEFGACFSQILRPSLERAKLSLGDPEGKIWVLTIMLVRVTDTLGVLLSPLL